MAGKEDDLFEVRCPALLTTKKGYEIRCDKLCCIATRGSTIIVKCRHCKSKFEAFIPLTAKSMIDIGYRNAENA